MNAEKLSLNRRVIALFFAALIVLSWIAPGTARAQQTNTETDKYAAVIEPGTNVAPGDLAKATFYFGTWNLVCDFLLSTKRRVCVIEQKLTNADIAVVWRLALTANGKPNLVFDVDNTVDRQAGLVLRMGKFLTNVPFQSCDQSCRAVVPFDGVVQQGVLSGELFGIGYTKSGNGAAVAADMRGFSDALAMLDKNPMLVFNETKPVVKKKPALKKQQVIPIP
ncbi:hypothetical protein AB4Y96_13200 [Phyllobacterium sp. TAF24]|uniref:hypothetical protein n=1 Tax=Phyllobacterium sp. TAF24 TaxID=3233068 RepID=UPI003F9B39CE